MSDDLPQLVDVSVEPSNEPSRKKDHDKKASKQEDEFKQVVSKRKRHEEKIDETTETKDDDDKLEEDYQVDIEELQKILDDKTDENQPLKKIRFPPLAAEKQVV